MKININVDDNFSYTGMLNDIRNNCLEYIKGRLDENKRSFYTIY